MSLIIPQRPATRAGKRARKNKNGAITSHTAPAVVIGTTTIPGPFPETWTRTFRYNDNFLATGGAAGIFGSNYPYSLNGMFDPYLGVGGHQPYGFDQLSGAYNSYVVTSCDVTVTAIAPNTGSVILGVSWRPSAGTFNPAGLGISDFAEKDNARWFYVTPTPGTGTANTYSFRFDIAKVEGKSRNQILSENEYQASPSANPVSSPQLYFNIGDIAGASSSTIALNVELTYTTVWRGRKTYGQS